ncbi:hypothetical protein Ddye_011727 [Dipteronia dyeriana]|uniref:Protein kinase domain-containing protein n=1 Tax=Dipteronia dyeriana TaxID=168575 RepID=A0AAD9X313_9ROSI|nr:hypothetical protein Ddye_011727 [Dipteronia dyeriana]
MEKYHLLDQVGAGAFGRVWKAINKHSGEVVAVKMLKEKFHYSWECLNLEEIKSLRILNIGISCHSRKSSEKETTLYSVFEFMEGNLLQLMRSRVEPFSENEVRR